MRKNMKTTTRTKGDKRLKTKPMAITKLSRALLDPHRSNPDLRVLTSAWPVPHHRWCSTPGTSASSDIARHSERKLTIAK
eukprot:Skav229164  [mRNA]  locus=scaffold1381:261703:264085:- [translate_table: standard]